MIRHDQQPFGLFERYEVTPYAHAQQRAKQKKEKRAHVAERRPFIRMESCYLLLPRANVNEIRSLSDQPNVFCRPNAMVRFPKAQVF